MTTISFMRRAAPGLAALVFICGSARADSGGATPALAAQVVPASEADLTARGEAAEREGRLADAAALFAQARALDTIGLEPARGACRVALALGNQADARDACHRAFMAGGTPEDSRHDVAAVMVGPTPPKMNELVTSMIVADGIVHVATGQPWGYAARCDIALRLEDRDMLNACVADLQRVAPDHAETKRALARAAALAVRPWVWLGRLALLLVLLGTAGHALRGGLSRRARRRRPGAPATGAIVLGSLLLGSLPGWAAQSPQTHVGALSGVPIDDAHPEAAVPTLQKQLENPLAFGYVLQDLLDGAANATKNGDYATATRFYRALTKAVPRRAYPFRKLCETADKIGDRAETVAACRAALSGEGVTTDDFTRYLGLMLAPAGPLSAETTK
ncbi:MAG TPA: hypothetical protein VH328_17215, partial [Burkholderiaceae bacterium]|nr:hypothetical protein [Burkholderiaceae bacterium]